MQLLCKLPAVPVKHDTIWRNLNSSGSTPIMLCRPLSVHTAAAATVVMLQLPAGSNPDKARALAAENSPAGSPEAEARGAGTCPCTGQMDCPC